MKNQNRANEAKRTTATGTTIAGINVLRFDEEDFEEAVVEELAAADVAEDDAREDLAEVVDAEEVRAANEAGSVIDIVVAIVSGVGISVPVGAGTIVTEVVMTVRTGFELAVANAAVGPKEAVAASVPMLERVAVVAVGR